MAKRAFTSTWNMRCSPQWIELFSLFAWFYQYLVEKHLKSFRTRKYPLRRCFLGVLANITALVADKGVAIITKNFLSHMQRKLCLPSFLRLRSFAAFYIPVLLLFFFVVGFPNSLAKSFRILHLVEYCQILSILSNLVKSCQILL